MNAVVYHSKFPEKIALIDAAKPELVNKNHCLIKVSHAALNRRDQWIKEGLYPGIIDGVILGSDGCGVVEKGPSEWVGKEVLVNPNMGWGKNPEVQSAEYQILGMPEHGTLADYLVVPSDRLQVVPDHLSATEAAAIPLAGLTAFRACFTKAEIKKDQKILITGIGGGVSQFALQFAVAIGAKVYVTSSSESKIDRALNLGAVEGFNYKSDHFIKYASKAGPFDAIVDSAGGNSVNEYLKIIRPGGRMVFYGSTTGPIPKFNMARLFWSQAQLMGSTMGNDEEFEQMIRFVRDHKIIPTIDRVFDKKDFLKAFERFKSPDHLGKIVLSF